MGDRKWINGKKGSNRERKSKDECKTLRGGGEKERGVGGGGVVLEGIEEEERETAGAGIKV